MCNRTTVGKMVEIASSIVSDDTAKVSPSSLSLVYIGLDPNLTLPPPACLQPGDLRILTGNELEQAKKLVTE
jgi:hypothetical protein